MPAKSVIGLLFLLVYLPTLLDLGNAELDRWFDLKFLLNLLVKVP